MRHTPISYSVASDYQVKQWGRTRGDVSTEAIPAQIGLEDGRYSFSSPVPTSIEEAHRFNDAARFLATAGNEFEDLRAELSTAKAALERLRTWLIAPATDADTMNEIAQMVDDALGVAR